MLQEIRNRLSERPFKRFVIRLKDGRELLVPRPEVIWLPPPNEMLFWDDAEDTAERIAISAITDVDVRAKKQPAKKARRRK